MMADSNQLPGATHLECMGTGEQVESEQLIGLSTVGKPLFARYDLDAIKDRFTPDAVACRDADLWRYEEVLPVRDRSAQVKLGEGWTPLTDAPRTADRLGVQKLWVKNEGLNPTGSFKDRGLCLAVSRALELGAAGIGIQYRNLCLRQVERVLDAGLDLRAWNPDTLPEQRAMIALGVKGISSNRPDILLDYLNKQKADA